MIEQLDVDGVPTLLAKTGGPMHAGLAFRVGTADETLARSGITHLLEHLALAPLGLADHHFNGATGPTVTYFHTQGSEQDIATFLTTVCTGLHDLPMQRLAVEKEILRTEWGSRASGPMDAMPLWRHGARDHGLASYPEFGLSMIGEEDLRAWAGRFFTRENAVLWIAGDRLPAGLRLPLPTGARRPVPAASSALPQTPAYFVQGSRAVALDAVVRRRTAASVFAGVLERELFRSLRQDGGLSYTATAGYEPRGDGYANLRALADALPEKQDAVLGGFIDVLAALAVGRIDRADLDSVVGKVRESLGTAEVHAARLPSYAVNVLTGQPNLSVDEYLVELAAVTVDDLHEVATEMMGSALLMVPDGCRADWAGFTEAPTCSTGVVEGTTYQSRDSEGQLRFGVDGVSYLGPGGPLTVRYADCAALLCWPDGARQLIGADAISLRIEPTLFHLHPEALPTLDTQVPVDRRVLMPTRPAERIPQPEPAAQPVVPAPRRLGALAVVTMVISGLATLVVAGFALLLTVGMLLSEEGQSAPADLWVVVVISWLLAVILALPMVLVLRRRRSQTN